MDCKDIKSGDLVLYRGGLFRVHNIFWDFKPEKQLFVSIGELLTVPIEYITKADWRDVAKITKGGLK